MAGINTPALGRQAVAGKARPTLAKIANECGYSVSTVSAVLNERSDCWASEATRREVNKVAKALGYRPNLVARSLQGGRTFTLGMLTAALNIEISTNKVQAFEAQARKAGYITMMTFSLNNDPKVEDRLIAKLLDHKVDGLVVYPTELGEHAELKRAIELGVPVVTMDGAHRAELACDDVSMDFYTAGQLQAEHLIAIGCKRLVQINTLPSCVTKNRLQLGFIETAVQAGLPEPLVWSIEQPHDAGSSMRDELWQSIAVLLKKHRGQIDAIASYDLVAVAAMRAAYELGICVPDELSVIGSDNSSASTTGQIPLTTIATPVDQIGQHLFELLNARIENKEKHLPPQRLRLNPSLIVRASTK